MDNFLLGSDPEFIVAKDGNPVIYVEDYKIDLEGLVTVISDNVLLEINPIPAASRQEFIEITQDSIKIVSEFIKDEFGLELTNLNSYDFKKIRHPKFFMYGCDPSYNIYDENYEINNPRSNERFCGGHIHIGYQEKLSFYKKLIRNCDYHIGLNLEEYPNNRRDFYGKAGEYRYEEGIKVEYRTPGNDWCFGKAGWMYDKVQKALEDTINDVSHEFDHTLINKIKVC
jgi:hypothetical protein